MNITNLNELQLNNLISEIYNNVEWLVKKLFYSLNYHQKLLSFGDVKNIALLAIYKQLPNYNPTSDGSCMFFEKYIKGAVYEAFRSSRGSTITQTQYKNEKEYNRFCDEFYNKNGYYPTKKEILEQSPLTKVQLNHISHLQLTSIPKNEDGEEIDLCDNSKTIEEKLIEESKKASFYKMVDELSDEYKEIVNLYLKGYTDKDIYTLKGYSRQNLNKKVKKIMGLLKSKASSTKLVD